MSSKKRKQKRRVPAEIKPSTTQQPTTPTQGHPARTEGTTAMAGAPSTFTSWPIWKRSVASALILAYLFVLIIGPLSNPIASQHLTAPIASTLSPLHRSLFMGHGYRFFAPNPGDSHLVQYKITRGDGTQFQGRFPDRDTLWPRLLYHRWFMLSETIFAEHAQTPSPNEFKKLNKKKRDRVELLKKGGRLKLADEVERKRAVGEAEYERTIKRIKALVRATGKFLLERHDGEEIEISVVTRTIPFPAEVRQGADLDDEVFLRYPANAVIGRFKKSDFTSSIDDKESAQ